MAQPPPASDPICEVIRTRVQARRDGVHLRIKLHKGRAFDFKLNRERYRELAVQLVNAGEAIRG